MCILNNFMEDQIFYLRLKQEHEHRMWCEFVEQKEAEEKAYDKMAEDHFKSLQQYEQELETI